MSLLDTPLDGGFQLGRVFPSWQKIELASMNLPIKNVPRNNLVNIYIYIHLYCNLRTKLKPNIAGKTTCALGRNMACGCIWLMVIHRTMGILWLYSFGYSLIDDHPPYGCRSHPLTMAHIKTNQQSHLLVHCAKSPSSFS